MEKTVSVSQKNYTQEEVAKLLELYDEYGTENIEQIAEAMGKPVKSIRSKLVREGVYKPSAVASKPRKTGPSKKDLLNDLESIVGFDTTGFTGATKEALASLIVYLDSPQE